jgi:hypothetical protein
MSQDVRQLDGQTGSEAEAVAKGAHVLITARFQLGWASTSSRAMRVNKKIVVSELGGAEVGVGVPDFWCLPNTTSGCSLMPATEDLSKLYGQPFWCIRVE